MTAEQLQEVRTLLATERVLALAVLVEGEPYVGLLPYVVVPHFSAVIVHASGLAQHTRGLQRSAPFSILIHTPDQPVRDPLQLPRLTLQGTVELIERGSGEYREGKERFVQRFPSSEPTFSLGDFNLYKLRLDGGRYVGGFAQAVSFSSEDLRRPA